MSPVLKGTMEIRLQHAAYACAEPDCPPLSIILDWRKIRGHESLSTISNVSLNGTALSPPGGEADKSVRVPYEESNEHLIFRDGVRMGENVIKLDFTSPILTSGSAITRYVDKEDGAEYIYSLFVPSDASTAFPVFDQPDLKARFELDVEFPFDWTAIANSPARKPVCEPPCFDQRTIDLLPSGRLWKAFEETKPISTYIFAFAAGPFERVEDKGGNPSRSEGVQRTTPPNLDTLPTGRVSASDADLTSSIYVRKSQAAKFKPHAAEVFRLNREGIKFLEQYFDYKFPFPKYDLVLIPEFPFGGMEHAGATFLRESSIIFPQEPTKSDYISRANLIFHEAAHQWFGDTVTMKWFDDLWLKEGFAEFMAYKTLERVMPESNAWKVFYERNKQAAYLTDSTKGTTPIYQEIANLNSAKSAYGNIVYRKAPSFLKQAEFYLGPEKFQTAVRAFLKKHEYSNAGWEHLVKEFEAGGERNPYAFDLSGKNKGWQEWAATWVKRPGLPVVRTLNLGISPKSIDSLTNQPKPPENTQVVQTYIEFGGKNAEADGQLGMKSNLLILFEDGTKGSRTVEFLPGNSSFQNLAFYNKKRIRLIFPNYQDYGYGIFLLDDKSRDYVLKNIGSEKDDFLRSMMWGSLWDSVREGELDPKEYAELAIRQLGGQDAKARASARANSDRGQLETDETIVASLLSRVYTALNYYIPAPDIALANARASATSDLRSRFEAVLLDRLQNAPTPGQRITFFRAFVANASTAKGREVLREMLRQQGGGVSIEPGVRGRKNPSRSEGVTTSNSTQAKNTLPTGRVSAPAPPTALRTKDRFDIVQRLIILGDPDALELLAELEKIETSDDAKRYAYAARAGLATAENKAKYWNDFVNNKDISESWIEAAFGPWNSIRHADLTLPYLERALKELPNHKRNRKIFFVNGWLGAFIGGQRSEQALAIVNKFLADNPNLDRDLRLKILENVDLIERAVKIRSKFGK